MINGVDGAMGQAARAAGAAAAAGRKAENVQEAVGRLERRLDRMALVCQALWELIRDNTSLGEDDLAAKVVTQLSKWLREGGAEREETGALRAYLEEIGRAHV